MSNGTRRKKKIFHAPEKKGELRQIPVTPLNRALSLVSLGVQAGMTAFGIWAVSGRYGENTGPEAALGGEASLLFLIFPLVSWILALGFRLACRYLPLDMWRLPVRVRDGMKRTEGTLLKRMTLLLELETAVCFFYIDVVLYLGGTPGDWVMLLWVAALCLSVYLSGRQAARIGESTGARPVNSRKKINLH